MNRLRAQRSGAPERTPFLKRSGREEPEPLGPAGKKGGRDGFIRGAIPIGRNAKEQEIGASEAHGDRPGCADITGNNNGRDRVSQDRLDRADIDIIPNRDESADTHPGFRIVIRWSRPVPCESGAAKTPARTM